MLVGPARSSAPERVVGEAPGGRVVAVGGAAALALARWVGWSRSRIGLGGLHASASGSSPGAAEGDQRLDERNGLLAAGRAVAPGPSPSWARTIAPSSMAGWTAASIAAAVSPRQSWVSALQPTTRSPRRRRSGGSTRLDAPRRAPDRGLYAERRRTAAPGRGPRRPPRRRARCARVLVRVARRSAWPSVRVRAIRPGWAAARGPRTKKVARRRRAARVEHRGCPPWIRTVIEGEREWRRLGLWRITRRRRAGCTSVPGSAGHARLPGDDRARCKAGSGRVGAGIVVRARRALSARARRPQRWRWLESLADRVEVGFGRVLSTVPGRGLGTDRHRLCRT